MIEPVFQEATQRLEAAGYAPDRVHHEVVSGADSRAMGLIQFARQNDIGTLVMGRRGFRGWKIFSWGAWATKSSIPFATGPSGSWPDPNGP
jgi:nucleotide-binding universal stress UspA family protein